MDDLTLRFSVGGKIWGVLGWGGSLSQLVITHTYSADLYDNASRLTAALRLVSSSNMFHSAHDFHDFHDFRLCLFFSFISDDFLFL